MRSDKQRRASKSNGRKSNGPITEAGKQTASRNAVTHNLSASRLTLLSTEDEQEFNQHQVSFLNRFQPIDAVEYDLVQKMICASWRERRISAMEVALFEVEMERQRADVDLEFETIAPAGRQVLALFGTTDAAAASGLLLRYAAAASRAYASALRILRDLQGDRFDRNGKNLPVAPIEYLPPASATASRHTGGEPADTVPEPDSAAVHASTMTAHPVIRLRSNIVPVTLWPEPTLQNDVLPNEPERAAAATACAAAA